jgi:xanthine dehydrogenase accessory factor
MKEIRDILDAWRKYQGQPLALATLVRARGSSYRRPGARMLICPGGLTIGSLSGGCLEAEVAQRAGEVLRTGEPILLNFDTRRRFGCHGAIEILLERVDEAFFRALQDSLGARVSCTVETVFEPEAAFRGSRILTAPEDASAGAFVQEILPPIRLIAIGDGPDILPFSKFSAILGWEIIALDEISDYRESFDERTAVIVATHNYGRDCAALRHLLPRGLRYLGLMGPRRRRDELLNDLLDSGVAITSGFFAPAGLHLEADSPEEIALSIIAEIQAVFARGTVISLRDRRTPIHQAAPLLEAPARTRDQNFTVN